MTSRSHFRSFVCSFVRSLIACEQHCDTAILRRSLFVVVVCVVWLRSVALWQLAAASACEGSGGAKEEGNLQCTTLVIVMMEVRRYYGVVLGT